MKDKFLNIKLNKAIIVDFILIVLIIIITGWYIPDRYKIINTDDFGYWGVAAHAIGIDWDDLMSSLRYYSFGYAAVLIPIFLLNKLGISMAIIYKLSLVENLIFLVCSYKMIISVMDEMTESIDYLVKRGTSFFIVMYMGISSRTTMGWVEVWLFCVFWILTWRLSKFLKNPNIIDAAVIAFLSVYIVACHMRAIGVTASVFLVLVFFFLAKRKSLDVKVAVTYLITLCISVVVFFEIKKYVNDVIYMTSETDLNDISNQVSRVKDIFSVAGVKDLFLSFVGKSYYAMTATFFLASLGCVVCVRNFFDKSKGTIENRLFFLFSFVVFMAETGICAIYQNPAFYRQEIEGFKSISDVAVFGRYHEFVLGLIVIFGILGIYYCKDNGRIIIISIAISVLIVCITQAWMNKMSRQTGQSFIPIRWCGSPWLSYLNKGSIQCFFIYAAAICLLIGSVLLFCSNLSRRNICLFTCMLIIGIWEGVIGQRGTEDYIVSKIHKEKTVDSVVDLLKNVESDSEILLIRSDYLDVNSSLYEIQYQLGARSIDLIDYNMLPQDTSKSVILADSEDYPLLGKLSDRFLYCYDSGTVAVFIEENSQLHSLAMKINDEQAICSSGKTKVNLKDMVSDGSYVRYNGSLYQNWEAENETYLTGKTGLSLDEGVYRFDMDLRIRDISGDIGFVEIGRIIDGVTYIDDTIDVSEEEYAKCERRHEIFDISAKEPFEPYIGLYTYGNSSIRLNGVECHKVRNNYQLDENVVEYLHEKSIDNVFYVDSNNSSITGHPYADGLNIRYLPGNILEYKNSKEKGIYLIEMDSDDEMMKEVRKFVENMIPMADIGEYRLYQN